MGVVEQLRPLNASIKVLVASILLPPAATSATSMLTDEQPAGVLNVNQTSYLVPAHDPAIPELVALNKEACVVTQVVFGVRDVGFAQLSNWAKVIVDNKIKAKSSVPVRAVVVNGGMVLLGF